MITPTKENSFCIAKWNEFSINLQRMQVRSCHLTYAIQLELKDYKKDPLLFFNNEEFNKRKLEQLNNIKHKGCNYCWKVEEAGFSSERFTKSYSLYNFPQLESIQNSIKQSDIYTPSYLELAFNNTCNLKCTYCSPQFSSSWEAFYKKQEILELEAFKASYRSKEEYKEIKDIFFNKTLPLIVDKLKIIRLTGGEVSIQNELYEIIEKTKNKNIDLMINTNLSSNDNNYNKFKQTLIDNKDNFKQITLFVSVDTFGHRAEFLRWGMDYKKITSRIVDLFETIDNIHINIMCTLTSFCINKAHVKFLTFIRDLKKKYGRTYLGMETIREPDVFLLKYLPIKFIKYYEDCLLFLKNNKDYFSEHEIISWERIISEINSGTNTEKNTNLNKIINLNNSLSKYRKLDFFKTFPEYRKINIYKKPNVVPQIFI